MPGLHSCHVTQPVPAYAPQAAGPTDGMFHQATMAYSGPHGWECVSMPSIKHCDGPTPEIGEVEDDLVQVPDAVALGSVQIQAQADALAGQVQRNLERV